MSTTNPEIPTPSAEAYREALRGLANLPDRFGHQFRQINLSPGAMEIYRQMIGAPDPLTDPVACTRSVHLMASAHEQRRLLEEEWIAEYRLADGPMRPFLAAVLAEPRDPLPRVLLGDAMCEFGWDRPACGHDARQTPPAAVTAAECLRAPEGHWSILRGVLRWHAYGLPVADVARLSVQPHLAVREGLKTDLAPTCSACGDFDGRYWGGRLDFVRCPCRGVQTAECSACGVGRPGWRWLCPSCRITKRNRFYHAKARTSPDRYRRILDYQRDHGFFPPDPNEESNPPPDEQ